MQPLTLTSNFNGGYYSSSNSLKLNQIPLECDSDSSAGKFSDFAFFIGNLVNLVHNLVYWKFVDSILVPFEWKVSVISVDRFFRVLRLGISSLEFQIDHLRLNFSTNSLIEFGQIFVFLVAADVNCVNLLNQTILIIHWIISNWISNFHNNISDRESLRLLTTCYRWVIRLSVTHNSLVIFESQFMWVIICRKVSSAVGPSLCSLDSDSIQKQSRGSFKSLEVYNWNFLVPG